MDAAALAANPAFVAVIDRIIPADDEFPPASSGASGYLARQLAPGGDLTHWLPVYTLWLAALEQESWIAGGIGFDALAPAEQDALLRAIEADETRAVWAVDPGAVLARLVEHVAEGYYADPEHNPGANPGKLSWEMIGFVERSGLAGSETEIEAAGQA